MGVALGLLAFFWLTRALSPLSVLLLCLGAFVVVAVLVARESGRRITPYTEDEQAQRRADEASTNRFPLFLIGGIILVIVLHTGAIYGGHLLGLAPR